MYINKTEPSFKTLKMIFVLRNLIFLTVIATTIIKKRNRDENYKESENDGFDQSKIYF